MQAKVGGGPGQQRHTSFVSLIHGLTAQMQLLHLAGCMLVCPLPTPNAGICYRCLFQRRQRCSPACPALSTAAAAPASCPLPCCCRYQDLQAGDIPVADKDGASGVWVGGWLGCLGIPARMWLFGVCM